MFTSARSAFAQTNLSLNLRPPEGVLRHAAYVSNLLASSPPRTCSDSLPHSLSLPCSRLCYSLNLRLGMSRFHRYQALLPSNSIWTRNLRHVDAVIPRAWSKRITFKDPRVKDVKPKDRIKWWNIVPGDQVRVRGDAEGTLREVQVVNKLRNMVYLKRVKEVCCIRFWCFSASFKHTAIV